jgi:hypothetical protein
MILYNVMLCCLSYQSKRGQTDTCIQLPYDVCNLIGYILYLVNNNKIQALLTLRQIVNTVSHL